MRHHLKDPSFDVSVAGTVSSAPVTTQDDYETRPGHFYLSVPDEGEVTVIVCFSDVGCYYGGYLKWLAYRFNEGQLVWTGKDLVEKPLYKLNGRYDRSGPHWMYASWAQDLTIKCPLALRPDLWNSQQAEFLKIVLENPSELAIRSKIDLDKTRAALVELQEENDRLIQENDELRAAIQRASDQLYDTRGTIKSRVIRAIREGLETAIA